MADFTPPKLPPAIIQSYNLKETSLPSAPNAKQVNLPSHLESLSLSGSEISLFYLSLYYELSDRKNWDNKIYYAALVDELGNKVCEHYRTVRDSSYDAIVVHDVDGTVISASAVCSRRVSEEH
jgi:PAS domain-containing protein